MARRRSVPIITPGAVANAQRFAIVTDIGGDIMGSFSIWHWVIVLGLFGGIGYAIWRSPGQRSAASEVADGGTLKTTVGPTGLGGWLVLVMLGQLSAILKTAKGLIDDLELSTAVPAEHAHVVYFNLAMNIGFLALIGLTTVQMFRTKRAFPTLWKAQGVAAVVFPIVDRVVVSATMNVPVTKMFDGTAMGEMIAAPIAIVIGWWYMNASVRVKNTFVN
jgi:hypothetical protein